MITDKEGGVGRGGVGVGGEKSSTVRLNSCKKLLSDVVPDEFPAGLRVLVVDDDRKCLMILEKLLQKCQYQVTTCSQSTDALSMLRGKRDGFDIVISDVHMPDMDGFKLLEHIGLEMDLPVIMMSADDKPDTVMKGVLHGACDYLVKPIRLENLKTIWQHVIRKKNNESKEMENSDGMEENERLRKSPDDADNASSGNEGSAKNSKRRKEEDNETEREDASTLKKQRVVWQSDLHKKFIAAVHHLGVDKAVPKKILELMNVPGLTRENVASHLQKFRIYLKRVSGMPQHQNGTHASFMAQAEANFGSMVPLDELDFQVFSANSDSLPFTDQRNMFTAETSSLRFGAGQQQRINTYNRQVSLQNGTATPLESKPLSNLNQPVQSFSNMGFQVNDRSSGYLNFGAGTSSFGSADTFHQNQNNPLMMQMPQSSTSRHLLNELVGSHASRLPLATGHQQIFSTDHSTPVVGRNRTLVNLGSSHHPAAQSSLVTDSLTSHIRRQTGNDLAFGNAAGAASFTSPGIFQRGENLEPTGITSFSPSYDTLNDFHQNKFIGRELQNDGLAFDASTIQGNFNLPPSMGSQQSYMCNQTNELTSNTSIICKSEISLREENAHGNPDNILRRHNSLVVENMVGVQAGRIVNQNFANTLPASHLTHQNDFGSLFGQQDLSGMGRPEIDSDWYKMDNIQGRVGSNLPGI